MKITALFVLFAINASASLRWEQKEITLEVHPVQTSAEAVFSFSNVGKKTITITDTKSSCSCLVPKWKQTTYAPGEKGVLKIVFDLRNRIGLQEKYIAVETSEGKKIRLTTKVTIPKSYSVSPIMMKWMPDNTSPTKTAKLKNKGTVPIRLLSVRSAHEGVPVELKVIRDGFEYEVVVTRPEAGKNIRSTVFIKTEPPQGLAESKTIKFYVHAR